MRKETTASDQAIAGTRRFDVVGWLRRYGTPLFLAALILFFALENSRFLSIRNVTNILTEVSIYGIIAVGMTFVILTAGVDLAAGSLLAFAGMSGAYVMRAMGADYSLSWLVAITTALPLPASMRITGGGEPARSSVCPCRCSFLD